MGQVPIADAKHLNSGDTKINNSCIHISKMLHLIEKNYTTGLNQNNGPGPLRHYIGPPLPSPLLRSNPIYWVHMYRNVILTNSKIL